jgi:hypothetical protein
MSIFANKIEFTESYELTFNSLTLNSISSAELDNFYKSECVLNFVDYVYAQCSEQSGISKSYFTNSSLDLNFSTLQSGSNLNNTLNVTANFNYSNSYLFGNFSINNISISGNTPPIPTYPEDPDVN